MLQVTALAFSPDGQSLASGSEDGSMMVWDLKDARRFGVTPNHKGPVWSLAFSQGDGAILASGMPAFNCIYTRCRFCLCVCVLWPAHPCKYWLHNAMALVCMLASRDEPHDRCA